MRPFSTKLGVDGYQRFILKCMVEIPLHKVTQCGLGELFICWDYHIPRINIYDAMRNFFAQQEIGQFLGHVVFHVSEP